MNLKEESHRKIKSLENQIYNLKHENNSLKQDKLAFEMMEKQLLEEN